MTEPEALASLGDLLASETPRAWTWAAIEDPQNGVLVRSPEEDSCQFGHVRGPWATRDERLSRQVATLAAQIENDVVGRDLLTELVEAAGSLLATAVDPSTSWVVVTRLAEAALVATEKIGAAGDLSAQRRLPLLRRARFLLLNAPQLVPFPHDGQLSRTQPLGPPREMEARAREARENWFIDLLNHAELPELARWGPEQIDREMKMVVLRPQKSQPWVDEKSHPSFAPWVVREALLPRFMLFDAWRALPSRARRIALAPLSLLAMTALLVLLGLTGLLPLDTVFLGALGAAAAAYLATVIAAGVTKESAYLVCLRLPAGASVGFLAFISFDEGWVTTPGTSWLWASIALLSAAWAYLFLEALAHGVATGAALGRSGMVGALGFAHGTAVAAIAFPAVSRALNVNLGDPLDQLSAAGVSQLYVLAASAGLAAGVFLQMLWDDRPVTYPLTHLAWKGRGRG